MMSSMRSIYLSFCLAAIFVLVFVNVSRRSMFSVVDDHKSLIQPVKEYTTKFSSSKCVSLEPDSDVDKLLSEVKLVYVVMPARAAGTTIKTFTANCMKGKDSFAVIDNILNKGFQSKDKLLKKAIMDSIELPSVIASHVYSAESLVDLIKHATRKSLIVYVHREEIDRLKSAIASVVSAECPPNTKKCKQKEEDVLEFVRQAWVEISLGAPRILTCDVYEAIEQNRPNMMFMNYQQADKLLQLLAKHHCPGQTAADHLNVRSTEKPVVVELKNNGHDTNTMSQVDIQDWVAMKSELIEFVTGLKDNVSCLAKTKTVEDGLSACPDQTMLISAGRL